MPSDIARLLRRNDPARWRKRIVRRRTEQLPFAIEDVPRNAQILLDTTVYIDGLQGHLPSAIETLLARSVVFHCAVARAELALSIGHLDPADPRTAERRMALDEALDRMHSGRRVAPSEQAWTEAAILTGILSRVQGVPPESRRALLNDALMLMTARERGLTLLSRNVADMDRLTVLRPDANVLLYQR